MVEISDMIEFVARISELELPRNDDVLTVKLCDLRDDTACTSYAIFDGAIEVNKVRGV